MKHAIFLSALIQFIHGGNTYCGFPLTKDKGTRHPQFL